MDLLSAWDVCDALATRFTAEFASEDPAWVISVTSDSMRDLAELDVGKFYLDLVPIDIDQQMGEDEPKRHSRRWSSDEVHLLLAIRQKQAKSNRTDQDAAVRGMLAKARRATSIIRQMGVNPLTVEGLPGGVFWKAGSSFLSREDLRKNALVAVVFPDICFRFRTDL